MAERPLLLIHYDAEHVIVATNIVPRNFRDDQEWTDALAESDRVWDAAHTIVDAATDRLRTPSTGSDLFSRRVLRDHIVNNMVSLGRTPNYVADRIFGKGK